LSITCKDSITNAKSVANTYRKLMIRTFIHISEYRQYLLPLFLLLLLISGCNTKGKKDALISEGLVKYTISYSPEIQKETFAFLLPEEMTYYFNPDNERISFTGKLGFYSLDFISNHTNDSSSTLLKIINKKMFVPSDEGTNIFIFRNIKNSKVEFQKDTIRTILGYEAHKATIQIDNSHHSEIVVWYTSEISTKTTNKNTPFAEIPGVMLEYAIYYNNVIFTLKPKAVEKVKLSEKLFSVPDDYTATTIDEIEKTIASIIY
jgi:GLPGLI family protein